MIRQTILSFAFILFSIRFVNACDACGCSVTTGGLGLLPQMHYNFVGMRWQHTVFHSVDEYDKSHNTTDQFDQVELWGRYYFGSRFQASAVVPYKMNTRTGENTLPVDISGLGDMAFYGFYSVIKKDQDENKPGHQLDVGAGIKVPTGHYDPIQDDKLPDNMNLGTASLDFIFQTIYSLKFKNSGITTNATYRVNTENKYGYRFGNRFAGSVYGYVQYDIKKLKLVPYGGIYLETISKDRYYDETPHGTGGHGLFGTLGLDFYLGKVTVGATFQQPFDQYYSDGQMAIQPKVSANVAYLF